MTDSVEAVEDWFRLLSFISDLLLIIFDDGFFISRLLWKLNLTFMRKETLLGHREINRVARISHQYAKKVQNS